MTTIMKTLNFIKLCAGVSVRIINSIKREQKPTNSNTNQPISTTIQKKPNEEEINIIEIIANKYVADIKKEREITFGDVNCIIYSSAITLKQIRENAPRQQINNTPKEPKWPTQL